MVSQPDHASLPLSSSLTVRGSSSVVSRPAASSRSRRYNRSHASAPSYIPQNEFPIFGHSGDVEIVVKAGGRENRYLLHRHTLTRCSGFFEASLSQEWAKTLPAEALPPPPPLSISASASASTSTELARIAEDSGSEVSCYQLAGSAVRGGQSISSQVGSSSPARSRWRYELDPGTGDGDIPMLVQKPAPPSHHNTDFEGAGTSPTTSTSIFGGPVGSAVSAPAGRSSSVATRSKPTNSGHGHPSSSSSSSSSSFHRGSGFFRSMASLGLVSSPAVAPPLSQADQDLLRDYDNLFRIFYNYSPVLDGVNIADAYVQCKSLLCLADLYDALAVVGPRVDHHMLQFQSRLWRQIAKYPISYLRLGYLARSKVIFQEALIHVVGQWPVGERSLRAALPDAVLDIIEDKVDELEELVSRVEGRLFRLGLVTSRGERVTPATSYLDWLAVSLFRQWLADNTSPSEPDRRGPPGGDYSSSSSSALQSAAAAAAHLGAVGRAFRTLGSVNTSSYLGHDDCKRFLKLTPDMYNRDNLRRFEKRIDELKGMARDVVRPLMGSGLELEAGSSGRAVEGLNYLTCTTVGDRDLPWPIEV